MLPRRKRSTAPLLWTAALFVLGLFLLAGHASAEKPPFGFDGMLVYLGDGYFNPESAHPIVPGCGSPVAGQCDGYFYQERYMKRSPAEIDAYREEAKAFFGERFGLDVDALHTDGRITFRTFFLDPRTQYRVHHISGQNVPPAGYRIKDGGWMVVINDPDGVELGGEFAGETMPAGGFLVYGDYYIMAPEPFSIHFRSGKPIVADADGSVKFQCDVYHPDFGWGFAQGVADAAVGPNGKIKQNIRNVLTFPGHGRRGGWR